MTQLIDISSLASCFKEYGPHPLHYLYRLIMPAESTAYNLLGNTVNTMFDAVVSQPESAYAQQFNQILQQAWHSDALLFLNTDDDSLNRRYFQVIQQQFQNVHQVVSKDFVEQGVDASQAWLEPSFVCPELGLSGRMDFLSLSLGKCDSQAGSNDESKAQIIELKSGKMNEWQHQAKQAHRVQTLLYSEILHRCFSVPKSNIESYLLYNTYPLLQKQSFTEELLQQAMDMRQQIGEILHEVATNGGRKFFTQEAVEQMYPNNSGKLWNNHDKPRLLEFITSIKTAPTDVQDWFFSRLQFILREEELKASQPVPVSLRNLPLCALFDKNLVEDPNKEKVADSVTDIVLGMGEEEHDFRVGDPVLLYQQSNANVQASQNIILRGSIAVIDDKQITITLRHEERLCHFPDVASSPSFALEHDNVNSSISQACRSIYRTLLNGGPKLQNCRLIVGPPGTGKTSVTLRNIIHDLLHQTQQHVLITAFTHRAVDEICETLESVFQSEDSTSSEPGSNYIRLGTQNDTPSVYHPHLLQTIIDQCPDRASLRTAIGHTRFWVGTTARLQATPQLFNLVNFDTIIADEASQLLDYQVIDILQQAGKEVILIGDPKQLPAVTLQPESQSLFEQLYRQGTPSTLLDHQGRMHPEIAQFANRLFYGNLLQPVGLPHQQETESVMPRFWFFDVPSPELGTKANPAEARMVARIVKRVMEVYEANQWEWTAKTLGIIVPYRQQIAAIRTELANNSSFLTPHSSFLTPNSSLLTPNSSLINIDTVERYQGSQRDIIIYTTTVSTPDQLAMLSAPIELDGQLIDRKLNVALTRARKHLFIVGNSALLRQSAVYQELLSEITDKMAKHD